MHETSTTTVLEPLPDTVTLDGDRADRFGTFLSVEAAADAVSTRSTIRSPRRRVLVGLGAAAVLASGLLAVNGVVGGPGPASVDPAVAIEQADGWTTISIIDPDATPAEIEAALEGVGIDARVEPGGSHGPFGPVDPSGGGTASFYGVPITVGPERDDRKAFYDVSSFEGAAPGDLTGLGVDFALPKDFAPGEAKAWMIAVEPIEPGSGEAPWADLTGLEAAMADAGVRVGGDLPDGTVSIRDGADVAVVLRTLS